MELITVTNNEATMHLWREKTSALPCVMQEYGDEEIQCFKKIASKYLLFNVYHGCSYGNYSSGCIKLDITLDKLVICDGELIGVSIDKRFLPLDFSYYLYVSYGGDHTLNSGVDKYFFLDADAVDEDVLNLLPTSSTSRKKIGELFKEKYQAQL